MEIITITCEQNGQNCYLIKNGKDGILIDPGIDTFNIIKQIEGTNVEYVLLTHCHYDHIFSVNELGKKVVSSKKCSDNIKNSDIVLMSDAVYKNEINIIMEDGEEREFCGIKVKCIYTPGHTDCSVCYLIGENLFSGDTLFNMSVGRWDLPTGNGRELENSIKNKIYTLSDDTAVFPGHGAMTDIGNEKMNNMYIKG